jgi:hypothetical protein
MPESGAWRGKVVHFAAAHTDHSRSLAATEALHYRGAAPGAERDRRQRMNKKLEEKKNKERLSKIVKLPENKKCFDCAGRGRTQYVVMPLWTFVCTGCSGVHREFSHRVLSITLHSFTKPSSRSVACVLYDLHNGHALVQAEYFVNVATVTWHVVTWHVVTTVATRFS